MNTTQSLSHRLLVAVALFFLVAAWTGGSAFAAVFTVTNTNDSGAGSLRQAITDSNANGEADVIRFAVGLKGKVIYVGKTTSQSLPALTEGNLHIDAHIDDDDDPNAGQPEVDSWPDLILDGSWLSGGCGLEIVSANNTVEGLVIIDFPWSGVYLRTTGSFHNILRGNYIGVDRSGTRDVGNDHQGVAIFAGAHDNEVGGPTTWDQDPTGNPIPGAGSEYRNLLSGNNQHGVYIANAGTTGNQVKGNYIGPDKSGITALGNTWDGVRFELGASSNVIGGSTTYARNVISGNGRFGICLVSTVLWATIQGNFIGTDKNGLVDLGNSQDGIVLDGGTKWTLIGGSASGEGNVIAGNEGRGIRLLWADENQIQGNLIGLDRTGGADRGNTLGGIDLHWGSTRNVIGGPGRARNVISGNGDGNHVASGVILREWGTDDNQVEGNYIGTDVSGTLDRGNTGAGVEIREGAQNNTVGGATAAQRNVISGNDSYGVWLHDDGTTDNRVRGNFIGVDAAETAELPNRGAGVALQEGASANVIGGNQTAGEGNVISGNDGDGVRLEGVWYAPRTVDNQVLGNYIGVGSDGTTPLPNIVKGVYLNTLADRNQIGGPGEGEGNVIAYNRDDGVTLILSGDTAAGNQITKNSIFENEGLGIDVKDDGVTPPPLTIDSLVNNGDGTYTISGTAPANAWVEVFLAAVDPTGYGEGQTFLAEALANASGNWTATIEANTGDPITATAYPDPGINNNTTEFSEVTYLPS